MLHNFKTAFTHFAKGEKLQGRDLAIVFSVVAILLSVACIVLQTVLVR